MSENSGGIWCEIKYVCVCVCVCVKDKDEEEKKERQGVRERDNNLGERKKVKRWERELCKGVCEEDKD